MMEAVPVESVPAMNQVSVAPKKGKKVSNKTKPMVVIAEADHEGSDMGSARYEAKDIAMLAPGTMNTHLPNIIENTIDEQGSIDAL